MSNKVLCIYPKDESTEFLTPLYEALCEKYSAEGLMGDPTDDDDYFDKLEEECRKAEVIVFLGHGSSKDLYGINLNPIICKENDNTDLLKGKKLILFACRSAEFIKEYQLKDAWGFGLVPTSLDDARNGKLHKLPISELESVDLKYFKDAINRIWLNSLKNADVFDIHNFYKEFSFYTNVEIVKCLREQQLLPNYRLIADMLYYLKEDMDYIE